MSATSSIVVRGGRVALELLYDDFRELRELGARGWVFGQYLAITLPSFLAIVLPLALLLQHLPHFEFSPSSLTCSPSRTCST